MRGLCISRGGPSTQSTDSLDADVSGHSSSADPLTNTQWGCRLGAGRGQPSLQQSAELKESDEGNEKAKKANLRRY